MEYITTATWYTVHQLDRYVASCTILYILYHTIYYNTIVHDGVHQKNNLVYSTDIYIYQSYRQIKTRHYNAILYNTVQYNTIQYNAIQSVFYNILQYNTVQYDAMQCNTIQHNTKQYFTHKLKHTVQCITKYTIQYNTILCDDCAVHITPFVTLACVVLYKYALYDAIQ